MWTAEKRFSCFYIEAIFPSRPVAFKNTDFRRSRTAGRVPAISDPCSVFHPPSPVPHPRTRGDRSHPTDIIRPAYATRNSKGQLKPRRSSQIATGDEFARMAGRTRSELNRSRRSIRVVRSGDRSLCAAPRRQQLKVYTVNVDERRKKNGDPRFQLDGVTQSRQLRLRRKRGGVSAFALGSRHLPSVGEFSRVRECGVDSSRSNHPESETNEAGR